MSESAAVNGPIRSQLSVPGGDLRKIEKSLRSDADAVFLDLEDSVAPDHKAAARATVVEALSRLEWGRLAQAVRVNGISTPWCYQDLIALVESGNALQKVVVPKVTSAGDVAFVDRLLGQLERQFGRAEPIRLEVQIEDAAGLMALREIARASDRITELTFGQGDFAAATGMPAVDIGVTDEWDAAVHGDRWLYPRQMIVFAAAAMSLRALNGPYAAYRDQNGFRDYCRMSRALGFAGVWCIHPDQIGIANEIFAPTPAEIERARSTIAIMEAGWSEGRGAVSRETVMIDEAVVRMARSILAMADSIASRK
jgi:citrate lyase beta subunit